MTKSDRQTEQPSPKQQPWLLVWLYRLLLLGVGGSLAALLGIVAATFYPQPRPEVPLVLKWWERAQQSLGQGMQPSSEAPASQDPGTASPLTPQQREELQAQLPQLQLQLKALRDRVAALETQTGNSRPSESLETRLQLLASQLQATPSAVTAPIFSAGKFQVTLPSDLLFQEGNSLLKSEANLILDKIASELGNYKGATILIAAHSDDIGSAEDSRALSFRRATAIEQYLANILGNEFHWVAVGYGSARPLVAGEDNRQRNRRIEIAIQK